MSQLIEHKKAVAGVADHKGKVLLWVAGEDRDDNEGVFPVDLAREYAQHILRLCDELDPPPKVEHIED